MVHASQLAELGFSAAQVRTAKKQGLLHPHLRAFVVREGLPAWATQHSRPFCRGLMDGHALLLSLGPGAIITGPTAALLHGCEGRGADAEWVDRLAEGVLMAYVDPASRVRIPGVEPIRAELIGVPEIRFGLPVADPVTALVDTLAFVRSGSLQRGRELLDLCLQLRWLTVGKLDDLLARHEGADEEERRRRSQRGADEGGRPKGRRARRTLAWSESQAADGTQSDAERLLAGLLCDAGLPAGGPAGWQANHLVSGHTVGGRRWRHSIDIAWVAKRVGIEVDGRACHGTAEAFEKDRERHRHLAAAGWRTIQVTWSMLTRRPREVIADVRRLLAQPPPIVGDFG